MIGLGLSVPMIKRAWVTDFALTDPSIVPAGVTITSRSETSLSFIYEGSVSRRRIYWPIQPTGTRYRFNVTTSGDLYFRVADTNELGPSGLLNLVPVMAAGTHTVDVTMPSYSVSTHMGFLISTIGAQVTISNWSAKFP